MIHIKNFENSQPSASNFKSFSRPLEQLFLTVTQNNFGNKIQIFYLPIFNFEIVSFIHLWFIFPGLDNNTAVIGSAEQYYDYSVLKKIDDISGGIGMPDLKLTACLAACYLVLFLTLWKGSSYIFVFYFYLNSLGRLSSGIL